MVGKCEAVCTCWTTREGNTVRVWAFTQFTFSNVFGVALPCDFENFFAALLAIQQMFDEFSPLSSIFRRDNSPFFAPFKCF